MADIPGVEALAYEVLRNTKTQDVGLSMNTNLLQGMPSCLSMLDLESRDAVFQDKDGQPIGAIRNIPEDVLNAGAASGLMRFYEVAQSGLMIEHILRFSLSAASNRPRQGGWEGSNG